MPELDDLEAAIQALEAQRVRLGSAAVDAAIAALRDQVAGPRSRPPPALSEGERKQVTVMFADLTGFTSLAEKSDAEDVRNVVNASFQHVGEIVERYGGYIDKFIGDELMVLFGAPVAMEDHALRCLHSALEVGRAVAELSASNAALRDTPLDVHIGINTGLVVAGAIGTDTRREYTVIGDPVNVAARLVARAQSGEILVGAATRRLAGDSFVFDDLGAVDLKGKAQAQEIFRLVRPRNRAESQRKLIGRSAMVGRDEELSALQGAFHSVATQGTARSVAVIGQPGIGKSRLLAEFRAWLANAYPRTRILRGAALARMVYSPYFTIAEVLRGWTGISDAHTTEEARDRLALALADLGIRESETMHALGAIIGIESEDDPLKDLAPDQLRARILSAFASFVKAVATPGPVVLILEDLHWADDQSIDLLAQDIPELESAPVLYLTLTRPIMDPQARARQLEANLSADVHIRIVLEELEEDSATALVTALAPGLDESTVQTIAAKGEGNPFFIEEIIGTLRDRGLLAEVNGKTRLTVDWRQVSVPDSVWGVLAERIDRLPADDKRVIQSAAVIGRVFWEGLASDLSQFDARPNLEQLDQRDFVLELGAASFADDREWMFRHVLVQEVAYSGLLKEARRAAHLRAAQWLEERVGDRRGEYATVLADHYEVGEDWDKAASYAEMAGDRAAAVFAYTEAKVAYLQALRAIPLLHDGPGARERQIAVTIKLSRVALYTPTDDVWKQLEIAKGYAEEAGDTEGRVRIIAGMAAWLYSAGQARPAFEMAMQAVAGARAAGLEDLLAVPQVIVSRALFILGDYKQCVEMLEQANALVEKYGIDFDDPARYGFLGMSYFQLGEVEKADALCRENLAAAQQRGDIRRIATAHLYIGGAWSSAGRLESAGEHLDAAAKISYETGDVSLRYAALGFLGHWHAQRGELEKAAECLDKSIRLAAELDSSLYLPLWQAYRADVHLRLGELDKAVDIASQAVALGKETRQQACESEAYHVLGWTHFHQGLPREQVEAELLAGIELRRKCNAEVLLAASLFDLGRYYQFVEDDEAARCAVDEATQIKEKYSLAWLPVPYPAPILSKS